MFLCNPREHTYICQFAFSLLRTKAGGADKTTKNSDLCNLYIFFNVCFLAIKCVMIPLVAIEALHKLLGKLQIQLVIGKSAQTLPVLLPHHLNWQ